MVYLRLLYFMMVIWLGFDFVRCLFEVGGLLLLVNNVLGRGRLMVLWRGGCLEGGEVEEYLGVCNRFYVFGRTFI